MIEFKKTEINLIYMLSRYFDIDFDGKKFYCHRCANVALTYDYIYNLLKFNSETSRNFELLRFDIDTNEVDIKSSFVEVPFTLDGDAYIIYSDEITVVFSDGLTAEDHSLEE